MRFSKGYINSILFIICIILSLVISNILLACEFSLAASYLIPEGITISLFAIVSFINYFIVKKYKKCTGIPISKSTSIVVGNNIEYQVIVDGKTENVTCYQTSNETKLFDNENLYLSKKNVLYREKSIMIAKPIIMLIILLIGISLTIIGLKIDKILFDLNFSYSMGSISESMGNIIVFKFCNFFLFGALLLLYTAIHESIKGKNKVDATIITSEEIEVEEEIPGPGHIKYLDLNVDRIVYRYMWKGEAKIFTPLINNAQNKKVGTTIKLNVDNDGNVVREALDIAFLFLGAFMMFVFYAVLLFTFFDNLF